MEHSFWRARWDQRKIGFHQADGNAKLREQWQAFLEWLGPTSTTPARALLPLCGKTQDLVWLAAQGLEVVGVEFVESAVLEFFEELGVAPVREQHGRWTRYQHQNISILVADFFRLTPEAVGPIDVIYDRAALVAVAPERQGEYMAQLARLAQPGCGLFLVSFDHDSDSGPPFSVDDVPALMAPCFESEQRAREDILEQESRFRERGISALHEVVWFARRVQD